MGVRLENLHVELFENIMTYLDISDIASFRLTSRTTESKVSQRSLATFFEQKNVELSLESLQKMVQVTSEGWLGSLLQRCTITGVVKNVRSSVDEDSTELLSLLIKAFSNLRQRSIGDKILSLHLQVAASVESANSESTDVPVTCSWRNVWDAALHTFNITMSALYQSRLPVNEHLDIFSSVRGCSLACDALMASFQESANVQSFRHLKTLRTSLSELHKPVIEHQIESTATGLDVHAQVVYLSLTLRGLTQLSDVMPDLETLDLH